MINYNSLMDRLEYSITELKNLVIYTKKIIEDKDNLGNDRKKDILLRLDGYEEAAVKQLKLAEELRENIQHNNEEEIGLLAKKINALSKFIRDDAREILAIANGDKIEYKQ